MGRNEDTTVRFSGLKSGQYHYDFTLDSEFFDRYKNEEIEGGNVVFRVEMEKKERMLLFSFHFEGKLETSCDRCLGKMEVPVEGEETLCVRFSDTETSDDEETVIMPESATEIDLAQWLYEYVAVRLPMQHMHAEGECDPETMRLLEAASVDEATPEQATDSRWDALKALLDKEDDDSSK